MKQNRLGKFICFCLTVATLLICYGQGSEDRVLMSDVQAITLYKGKMTTGRRVPAIPQIECVGGSSYPSCYVPETVQCYNKGSDGKSPQWHCEANLKGAYELSKVEVDCEGYDNPDDPYILAGSCGLKYNLVLTEPGGQSSEESASACSGFCIIIGVLITIWYCCKNYKAGQGKSERESGIGVSETIAALAQGYQGYQACSKDACATSLGVYKTSGYGGTTFR